MANRTCAICGKSDDLVGFYGVVDVERFSPDKDFKLVKDIEDFYDAHVDCVKSRR